MHFRNRARSWFSAITDSNTNKHKSNCISIKTRQNYLSVFILRSTVKLTLVVTLAWYIYLLTTEKAVTLSMAQLRTYYFTKSYLSHTYIFFKLFPQTLSIQYNYHITVLVIHHFVKFVSAYWWHPLINLWVHWGDFKVTRIVTCFLICMKCDAGRTPSFVFNVEPTHLIKYARFWNSPTSVVQRHELICVFRFIVSVHSIVHLLWIDDVRVIHFIRSRKQTSNGKNIL